MKVKQLKINSFRGISDLTLDFDLNEPTIFVGANEVGKSNILDCIAILLSWLTARIQNPHNLGIILSDQDVSHKNTETTNQITILTENNREIRWSLTKVFNKTIKDQYGNLSSLNTFIKSINQQLESDSTIPLPLAVFYPTTRTVFDTYHGDKTDYSFDITNINTLALTKGEIDFRLFFKWFQYREALENENYRYKPEKYPDLQLEAVRQAVYQILEGFSNLRVQSSPLQMTIEKEGNELTVQQLSSGEKNLLAIFGDLAMRLAIANPNSDNPLNGSAVVLIDEIEQHFHAILQRKIISRLTETFPQCQFILTTHSPQILSCFKPKNIYVLESTEEGIIARHPQSSYGRDSNSILEDIMGVPERPQEIKEDILQLFRLIDEGNLQKAQELRQEIANKIGSDEPELKKAATSIRRREILNR